MCPELKVKGGGKPRPDGSGVKRRHQDQAGVAQADAHGEAPRQCVARRQDGDTARLPGACEAVVEAGRRLQRVVSAGL